MMQYIAFAIYRDTKCSSLLMRTNSSIEDLFASTESAHPPQLFDTTGMVRIALMFNIVGTFI